MYWSVNINFREIHMYWSVNINFREIWYVCMKEAKPIATPVNTDSKLVKATEKAELVDQDLYQSAVVSLQYLSTVTRPDIT